MQNVKNYIVNFIDNSFIPVTKEQAEKIASRMSGDEKGASFLLDGEVYRLHQVTSVKRDKGIENKAENDVLSALKDEFKAEKPKVTMDFCTEREWERMSPDEKARLVERVRKENEKSQESLTSKAMRLFKERYPNFEDGLVIKAIPELGSGNYGELNKRIAASKTI